MFSDKDKEFNNYWLQEENLESKILNITKKYINQY